MLSCGSLKGVIFGQMSSQVVIVSQWRRSLVDSIFDHLFPSQLTRHLILHTYKICLESMKLKMQKASTIEFGRSISVFLIRLLRVKSIFGGQTEWFLNLIETSSTQFPSTDYQSWDGRFSQTLKAGNCLQERKDPETLKMDTVQV